MFIDLDQLKGILEPHEFDRLMEAASDLADGADSGDVYSMLRELYDRNKISLTSFCRVFNWLADDELPVMTYRNDSLDRLARTKAPEEEGEVEGDALTNDGRRIIGSQFKPLGKLGEGASGEVMIARDTHLERRVALKRLKYFETVPEHVKKRFINEAQVTAQLDHPNIIPIYGLQAQEGEHLGYAMKLVRGNHLGKLIEETRKLIKSGKRLDEEHSLNNRLDYFLKVCDAIDFAHSKGVLHRDLKPQNIMLGRFHEAYVMDWGIAQLTYGNDRDMETMQPVVENPDLAATLSQDGSLAGTPLYMSPEQANGDSLDERSDQYTLGLILYELVCLQRANSGKNRFEVITRAMRGKCEPVRHCMPRRRIPRELAAIIEKSLARNPDDRYPSVHDMAADLRRFLRGEEILARPDSWSEKLLRQIGRHQQVALLMILLTMFMAAGTLIWNFSQTQKQAMELAARQTRRVSRLMDLTNDRAVAIDNFFRNYESALQNLATEAETLLKFNEGADSPVYDDEIFNEGVVPGWQPSVAYGRDISPYWPVFYNLNQPSPEGALQRARALSPLRHHFRKLMTLDLPPPRNDEELDRYVAEKRSALVWVYLVFYDGSMLLYPGIGGFPEDYDPRSRPWYHRAKADEGIRWHNIYHTVTQRDPEMPCTMLLRDSRDQPIGLIALNIACNRFSKDLLPLDEPGVRETYLLNSRGNVLATAGQANIDMGEVEAITRPFPYPDLLPMLKENGHLKHQVNGRELWFAYRRLDTQDWSYVVEVDPSRRP
ncbi:MAG: serine/threonine protein kinase [Acidobacteriota bacterium]|nr:serine/threonine protein kinase [Acidobacteriota bacterium]